MDTTKARKLLPSWLLDANVDTPESLQLLSWDDGFVPSGSQGKSGKLLTGFPRSSPRIVHIENEAVVSETAELLYQSVSNCKSWGIYIEKHELFIKPESEPTGTERRDLCKRAIQEFLIQNGESVITKSDWEHTHGVAVWLIASDEKDETEYHLDYAESVRYETNVIVPPLYSATLHISPLYEHAENDHENIEGGAFYVNHRGLDHYKEYGYKTRLKSVIEDDDVEKNASLESEWQRVAYHYRRGIICDGELPHFSSRIQSLPSTMRRVIVGFNLFTSEIGPFVQELPEHSEAFNKHIRLSQFTVKHLTKASMPWTIQSMRENPKQAAFFKLLAQKMREKGCIPAA
uniref:Uncharacterized protein AlNc14C10G1223 n=1 Tax=Albugo laibachii Nc14 TaxID=890382 RepID=F0W2H2_9STRA|nr:conserved hypothetical protein [Albugo laibachii Nc14]|eukprot:CCA15258.1 conserved hypothetical protein [Albugo laibachii Nc14]